MACQRCKSERVAQVSAKHSDMFGCTIEGVIDHDGYGRPELGIGDDSDYIEMDFCLECGQIQGLFPRPLLPEEEALRQG